MKQVFAWTPEVIDQMLAMQRQGHSLGDIAKFYGITRNTVCGKLHREKIARGLSNPTPRNRDNTVQKRAYNKRSIVPTLAPKVGFMLPAPMPKLIQFKPDEGQLASIVDVTGCRWPVRDDKEFVGGVAFCNHEKAGGSYCAFHAKAATVTIQKPVKPPAYGVLRFEKRKAA